jgi:RNA polymerase sigma-70 factor (ECF subfamily)
VSDSLPSPEEWVEAYGDDLLAYALLRVGDRDTARDLVQETFLSALKGRHGFAGRSAVKTWLIGILKNKVVDHFRRTSREAPAATSQVGEEFFDESGRWKDPPGPWRPDPSEALGRRQFWEVLHRCLAELPRRHASAFSLRELEGLPTDQLCKVLGVTTTHLWVLRHRARLALRRCLERNGFGGTGEEVA